MDNQNIIISRIESAISRIGLDLSGQTVLTEAASGPYISTPIIAALAGASCVYAVTRDSEWGTAEDICRATRNLARRLGVNSRIELSTKGAEEFASSADVVTNLGFVRPISCNIIERLPRDSAIGLMWEPWELRQQDIDLSTCIRRNIPVIGTNEHHPDVATFRFVGILALKLLLEVEIEVQGLKLLVIGSNPFGSACVDTLSSVGALVTHFDPTKTWPPACDNQKVKLADAIVVVEHRFAGMLLGESISQTLTSIIDRGIPVIHICGLVDAQFLSSRKCIKHPLKSVPFGYMTVTTAHVGLKPVVDLHTAGLMATSIVARARKAGASVEDAIKAACKSGFGLSL